MPLKPLSYRKVKRKLEAAGFQIVSQKGSHINLSKKLPKEDAQQLFLITKKLPLGQLAVF